MPSADSIHLRPLRRADFAPLATLLREVWPDEEWELRFRRQWLDNPAMSPELAMGWVFEEGGEMQATFGSIPLPYRVAGRPATAFASTALYVRPALRGRGVGTALIEAWSTQPGGELWITTTSNDPSARILERGAVATWRREEREARLHLAALPLAAARRALARRLGGSGLLSALSFPLAAGRALQLLAQTRSLRNAGEALECRRERSAPDELDELWERLAPHYPTTFRRDAATLRWLLFDGPRAERNHLITCREPGGALRATAVFRAEPERSELRQVDAFGERDDPRIPRAIARAALASARAAGLETVRLWAADERETGALASAGLRPVPCAGVVHYHFREPAFTVPVYFTDIDGDKALSVLL